MSFCPLSFGAYAMALFALALCSNFDLWVHAKVMQLSSNIGRLVGAKNVLGKDLESCSHPGMALTGFTRTGLCVDSGDDDAGSHHICIVMKPDFCSVTGQPNWCAEKMECMGNSDDQCPIVDWCVCQWAFANYLQEAGGCDEAVDVVCEAINQAAINAYSRSTDPTHQAALQCIKKRCGSATAI
jgi:uncharacterized protein (DUF2237 family)